MLESVLAKERMPTVDAVEPAEGRRGFIWSRCRCLFFVLVLGAVLFVCSMDLEEMKPDWNPTWLTSFKKLNLISSLTDSRDSRTSSSALRRTDNITSTKVTNTSNTLHGTSNSSEAPQQKPEPPTPVPYQSPGPYLVEYPYEYHFVINEPKTCEQQKPFLVLMVPVAPHNRAHRDVIRSTWGGESLVLGNVVKLFFLLGLQTGEGAEQLQEQLLQESKEHRDLIQSDFLDCYKNLTIKTMVMLEWLDSHCSGASYAMKIDSDMFLNLSNLIRMLLNAPKTNYMTGLVARGGAVLRDTTSKWYVPEELYSNSHYPPYALGLGYVLSLDLPKKLVEASRHVKPIYIEDVSLGLCLKHLGIDPTDPPGWGYFNVFPVEYSRCAYSRLVATTTHAHADRVKNWEDFKKPGPYCRSKK